MDSILNFLYTNITGNIVNALVYVKNATVWLLDEGKHLIESLKGLIEKWGGVPILGLISGPITLPLEAFCSIAYALMDAISFVVKSFGSRLDAFASDLPTATYSIFAFVLGMVLLWPYVLRFQNNPVTQTVERVIITPVASALKGLVGEVKKLATARY